MSHETIIMSKCVVSIAVLFQCKQDVNGGYLHIDCCSRIFIFEVKLNQQQDQSLIVYTRPNYLNLSTSRSYYSENLFGIFGCYWIFMRTLMVNMNSCQWWISLILSKYFQICYRFSFIFTTYIHDLLQIRKMSQHIIQFSEFLKPHFWSRYST